MNHLKNIFLFVEASKERKKHIFGKHFFLNKKKKKINKNFTTELMFEVAMVILTFTSSSFFTADECKKIRKTSNWIGKHAIKIHFKKPFAKIKLQITNYNY